MKKPSPKKPMEPKARRESPPRLYPLPASPQPLPGTNARRLAEAEADIPDPSPMELARLTLAMGCQGKAEGVREALDLLALCALEKRREADRVTTYKEHLKKRREHIERCHSVYRFNPDERESWPLAEILAELNLSSPLKLPEPTIRRLGLEVIGSGRDKGKVRGPDLFRAMLDARNRETRELIKRAESERGPESLDARVARDSLYPDYREMEERPWPPPLAARLVQDFVLWRAGIATANTKKGGRQTGNLKKPKRLRRKATRKRGK